MFSSFALGLLAALAVSQVQADVVYGPETKDAYAAGNFGIAPSQSFVSRPDLSAPAPNIAVREDGLAPGYIFVNYIGENVPRAAPMILDQDGHPVYIAESSYQAHNFHPQSFQGHEVLTAWSGAQYGGHGEGKYSLLDHAYNVIWEGNYQLADGSNAPMSDFHEFVITDDDTFLFTSYGNPVQTDLTQLNGQSDGWVYDCHFQELDPNTNQVLFNWSALDHGLRASDTTFGYPTEWTSQDNPFDYCHINSVQKDDDGTYLISARGPSSLYKIDGQSGDIIWSLSDVTDDFDFEQGAGFWYQHDARWLNASSINPRFVSLYDNQRHGDYIGRGLVLSVDSNTMEVDFVSQYTTTRNEASNAMGSTEVLPNYNALVGHGFMPEIAEYSADGTLLFDMFLGSIAAHAFEVATYRAWKSDWTGVPNSRPDVGFQNERVYMSWNGDTQVAQWALASGPNRQNLSVGQATARQGFETDVAQRSGATIAAVALDAQGGCVGVSRLYNADGSETGQFLECGDLS